MKRKLGQVMLAVSFLLPAFALDLTLLAAVASTCKTCKTAAAR